MSIFTNRSNDPPQERAGYAGAILDLLADRDPIAVLRDTPSAVAIAIDGLRDDELRRPESPGKWSIVHVLQHLSDSELVWGWRLRLIISHDRPTITGYDQDLWADRLHYADADPAEALSSFTVLRRGNVRVIEHASPHDLKRVGVHDERGDESLEYLCRLYAGHDLLHLRQIARIRNTPS